MLLMCFAIPGIIVKVKDDTAEVSYEGVIKECKLLVDAKEGDYVISQAGVALAKVEKNEALKIFEAMKK